MKRASIIALIIIISVQCFGDKISFSVGATAAIEPVWLIAKDSITGDTITFSWMQWTAGGFIDATYVQVGVYYAFSGTIQRTLDSGGYVTDIAGDDNSLGLLEMTALGKYPILLGPMVIYPVLEFEYSICISVHDFNTPFFKVNTKDFSDFYALGGVGADIRMGKKLFLRLLALFGYNLTAKPPTDISGAKWSGFKVGGNASIGFKM